MDFQFLIDIFPQSGSFVAPIRMKQVQDSQFARTALEMALDEVAAQNWTEPHAAEAHANLADQKRHAAEGDTWGFYLDNERFHQLIARCEVSGPPRKTRLLRGINAGFWTSSSRSGFISPVTNSTLE